jgi:hypothetical protein
MAGLVRAAAGALVAAVLILGAGTFRAVAEDDDNNDNRSFDKKMMDDVMVRLGLKPGPDIDYHERSPLVLPPKIDLPPPQPNAAAAAPNWPVDPDIKRRHEEANRRRDFDEESKPLRPAELNVGQRVNSQTPGANQEQMDGKNRDTGFTGSVWNALTGKKEEAKPFTSEPPRSALTEPPVGYQTPSPSQPYAAKSESWVPKIPTFFDFGTDQK